MKKWFSWILSLLLAVSAAAGLSACGGDKGVRLKVGMISDIHCTATTSWNNHFVKALERFRSLDVDAIVIAGDITDKAFESNYKIYGDALKQVYGETPPEMVLTMGNHDFWKVHGVDSPSEEMEALFESGTGRPANDHVVVKGFHFITVAPDGSGLNYKKYEDWLKSEVEKAAADAPGQPFFVVAHTNAKNTTPGASSQELYDILAPYPQAVCLSGHTHFPVQDERSIFQKDFTSVDLGSAAYVSLAEGNYLNRPSTSGQINSFGMVMSIGEEEIRIDRICLETGEREKTPWTLALPLSRETFAYTSARADSAVAPEFPAGAQLSAAASGASVELTFPAAACQEDMVYGYRIRAEEVGTGEKVVAFYASDFYRGLGEMKSEHTFALKGLKPGQTYRITVAARESFGKFSGRSLEITYAA